MNEDWYYMRDQQQYGPFEFTDLVEMSEKGVIAPTDLLWKEGMAEWSPASSVTGLFGKPAAPAYVSPFAKQAASNPASTAPPIQMGDDGNQYAPPQTTAQPTSTSGKGGIDWAPIGGGCLISFILAVIGIIIGIVEVILDG